MNLYDFQCRSITGEMINLSDYSGQVVLIVNVASKCGFTSQYQALETLYQTYRERGFVVLGFPCNQFGGQEPADNESIKRFCTVSFGVTFPLFAKVKVNGNKADPLFQYLQKQQRGLLLSKRIKWNFTKFLVDRQGQVVNRFSPSTKPETMSTAIEKLL